jgi:hypothetical protein
MLDYINELLYAIANWLTEAIRLVLNGLYNAFNNIAISIKSMLASMLGALDDAFAGIVATLRSFAASVQAAFTSIINGIKSALDTLWSALYQGTVNLLNAIGKYVNDAIAKLSAAIGTIVDKISGYIAAAFAAIKDLVVKALDAMGVAIGKIVDAVVSPIKVILDRAAAAVTANEQAITAEWKKLVAGSESLLSNVETKLSDLSGAFTSAAKFIKSAIEESFAQASEDNAAFFKPYLDQIGEFLDPASVAFLSDRMTKLTQGELNAAEFRDMLQVLKAKLTATNGPARYLFFSLLLTLGFVPFVWNMGTVLSAIAQQELAASFPYALLSPADAVAAWRQTFYKRDRAVEVIKRQGYTTEDANVILDLSETVPSTGDLLSVWRRGLIDDGVLDAAMFKQGFSAGWRDVLKDASEIIPPVQDLITMAVREAFSPEIATQFGQYEDFPGELAEFADKQGLSMEWAKRYWAAHWSLPSADQGFEMLHRGVIDFPTLERLLRALDVMPYWRDKLTAIAYNPYSRVDIRRMNALGILDEAGVLQAYKDIGYDDQKAATLTKFTLRLNKHAPAEDDAELGKLSRATILGFYGDGLLPRARAQQLLELSGHTPEAASLYLDSVDADQQRAERKTQTDLIIELAQVGNITFEQAQDELNRIGLSTLEVEKALARLAVAQRKASKLPSQSDGEAFFRSGIISEGEFRDLMLRLGYSQFWVDAYLKLIRKDMDATQVS